MRKLIQVFLTALLMSLAAGVASAQSFRVQCPTSTITHPDTTTTQMVNSAEPAYAGPTSFTKNSSGYQIPSGQINGAIKCQQVSGGDGYATMADGTQIYLFAFGPLSGLADMANGLPGTEFPNIFNSEPGFVLQPGDPATTIDAPGTFNWNGAVGEVPDADCIAANAAAGSGPKPCPNLPVNGMDGHVDARQIIDVGVMNGNIPAPLMAIDEDDEFFLTLTNVGMIQRPDLFEQHTIHFHGYPNASSFYDGVPDASVAINIGGSFTYYYLAPDAGTYFWHCHITPPEHLQMGMVGQVYVRPRQNRVAVNTDLYTSLGWQQADLRTACGRSGDGHLGAITDIMCSNPLPAVNTHVSQMNDQTGNPFKYAYNDGDGSTKYNVEYPIQMHGFDPNFHFVGMTFNPEGFTDMKDKYFLLNGRSYPDTVTTGPMQTVSSDGANHFSQPLPSIINIPVGGRALLRLSNLSVSEYHTLASMGIPMTVIALNAKLLRDQSGNNLYYNTNSITLGGGESLDVILDASNTSLYKHGSEFYVYTPNLDELSNDAENFGGMMTEVHICQATWTYGQTCN